MSEAASIVGAQHLLRTMPAAYVERLAAIERLGRGDVVGLSWLLPPYQWQYGANTTQPMQAFEFDARAVRAACDQDPGLGSADAG